MALKFTRVGEKLPQELGKMLAEAFVANGKAKVLKESFGITFKEAGQTTDNNTGAYVDLLAKTLYSAALEKSQKILDLVDINEDLLRAGSNGFGAMQLPRLVPTIAYEVSEGAKVNFFDEGIDPVVVTPRKVVTGTSMTWEIKKRGMNDFVKFVIRNAAQAIERKLCSDIVNGLAAGSSLTAESGGIDYAAIRAAEVKVNNAEHSNGVKYGFIADALVIATSAQADFYNDETIKGSLIMTNAQNGFKTNAMPSALMFGNMEVIFTPYLTAADGLVLERKRNILVKESDLETFEGRIPGSVDDEVIAVMSYVLAMMFPSSVCAIEE